MNVKLQQILRRYETRWAEESRLLASLPMAEAGRRLDEFLLPIGPETGFLLAELVRGARSRNILEVGASYGYSTLWLADAAHDIGGRVISLELSPEKIAYAGNALEEAGLRGSVEFIAGDALAAIARLTGPFDLVLIDLWKDLYLPVFDAVYPKLAPGALIVADNMIEPAHHRDLASAYRAHVHSRPEIESVLLPLGSGIEISRYRVAPPST
jgi:predicted O-methyltransferase YrrM